MKEYKLINFCEFNAHASKSYCAIHGVDESKNLGDITKVDETKLEPFNMIVGGSPCQDFSVAGKQKGSVWTCEDCDHEYNPLTVHWSKRDKCPKCNSININKSRSSLLVEWLRIIRANKPNIGVYENVKNIVGKEFKETTFKMFEKELNEYGYNTYWKVLNAKDYGIPQKRERLVMILIKKDIDNNEFKFPEPFDNGLRLKDIIENEVGDKYYLTEKQINSIYNWNAYQRPFKKICGRNSICPTITARGAGEYHSGMILYSDKLESDTNCEMGTKEDNIELIKEINPRVLTELESFRIMGFSDEDYNKCTNIDMKKREVYRQSGNSIVIDMMYYILLELYEAMPYLFCDLKLSSFFSGIGAFEKALDRLYTYINNNDIKL